MPEYSSGKYSQKEAQYPGYKGTAHKYSDLDFSYIPVQENNWNSITIMIGGHLCDLYALHSLTFDKRLQEWLTEHDVPLCTFAILEELESYLNRNRKSQG